MWIGRAVTDLGPIHMSSSPGRSSVVVGAAPLIAGGSSASALTGGAWIACAPLLDAAGAPARPPPSMAPSPRAADRVLAVGPPSEERVERSRDAPGGLWAFGDAVVVRPAGLAGPGDSIRGS